MTKNNYIRKRGSKIVQGYVGNASKAQKWKFVRKETCDLKGHSETVIPAVKPTCTKAGNTEGKKCSVCGKILKATEVISALGHKWDNGKITKQPTETENGIKTYTCTVCGNTKTESISLNDIKDTDDQNEDADGVGVISADGTILTDTDGDMYLVADKITNDKIFKNASVADKSSGGKYKITKITKEDDVVVSGTVTYMKPYNKNCKTANVKASIIIGGAKFKVTAIASKAFKGCKKLTKVTIKSNVKTIGASAFAGCKKLNSVKCTSKVLTSRVTR